MARIPVAGPWITEKEVAAVADAAAHAWYGGATRYVERFEAAFAAYLGVRYAVSLPSCTAGIHLALLAGGIGPGDEVIVPDCTWIATSAPVNYVGATPVFADIDPATWCLTVNALEQCVTSRTRAVIAVDLYGSMPAMGALRSVTQRHGLLFIEDAAEAIGSEYKGRKAGSLGDVGVFSFHGSKTLTTGEGGMLVTNDEDVFRRVLVLRDHGRLPGDTNFWNAEVGYKYKMSSFQAAFGLAQLERVEELVARKRQIFSWYQRELQAVAGLTLNAEPPETRNSYWMVTVVMEPKLGITKATLIEELARRGIDTRPFFHPLSSLPAYHATRPAKSARYRNVVSYQISPLGVNLPSALSLTAEQVHYVCAEVKGILTRACRQQAG